MAIILRLAPFLLLLALTGGSTADNSVLHTSPLAPELLDEEFITFKHNPTTDLDSDADFLDLYFEDALDEEEDGFDFGFRHRKLQSSSTTTTTRCNFWCQLKNSLGQTVVGLILICLSPCLMWKNEGRHVNELRRIDFCKNKAVVVQNIDMPTEENNGQLIHFTGEVTVDDNTIELEPGTALNITEPLPKALVVKRTCLIYQKFEEAHSETKSDVVGGGQTTVTTYSVREDWTPMPQPETLPHLPQETNSSGIWNDLIGASGASESGSAPDSGMPPQFAAMFQICDPSKAPHGIAVSPAAHVGGYALSKDIIMGEAQVFQAEWTQLPSDLVPEEVDGCPGLRKALDGSLTTVAEGEQPTNGDVMVKYEYVADGFDASFIVQQVFTGMDPESGDQKFSVDKADVIDDKCCGKIHDDLGKIWMVRRGKHDLGEMISMAKEDEKNITKILRFVCWLLLVVGWILLFSIFTTLMSTLPILKQLGFFAVILIALIVGTVCCCGVTAFAYIRYRPVLAIGIIAVSLAIWGLVIGTMGEAAKESNAPTFAPTMAKPVPAPVPAAPVPAPVPAPSPSFVSPTFFGEAAVEFN